MPRFTRFRSASISASLCAAFLDPDGRCVAKRRAGLQPGFDELPRFRNCENVEMSSGYPSRGHRTVHGHDGPVCRLWTSYLGCLLSRQSILNLLLA